MFARPQPRLISLSITDPQPVPVNIWYIAHRLGRGRDEDADDGQRRACTERWLVNRIRQLVEHCGFPPPVAPRVVAGEVLDGAQAVTKFAMWHQAAVDQWFDDRLPPTLQLVVDNDVIGDWSAELAARTADRGRGQGA